MVGTSDFDGKPILRWAGGKQHLVPALVRRVPPLDRGARYFEPFLGAASLFVALRPQNAVLSDLNQHLIEMYRAVRDAPEEVARLVMSLGESDSERHYYAVRDAYNASEASPLRAAQFIYLNRSCYNGVFRVNRQGTFNVPYGFKSHLLLPSREALVRLGAALGGADLRAASYERVVEAARPGDFVYLDPPYPPLNGTAFFRHYTKERFGDGDQAAVAVWAQRLRERGCRVLVSNADTPGIRALYAGWQISEIEVRRSVSYKSTRRPVAELLIESETQA